MTGTKKVPENRIPVIEGTHGRVNESTLQSRRHKVCIKRTHRSLGTVGSKRGLYKGTVLGEHRTVGYESPLWDERGDSTYRVVRKK